MINPVNILNDRISKASELVTFALRSVIHSNRANKLNKIDLRKYRGNPKKKEQIRELMQKEAMKASCMRIHMLYVISQPIKINSYASRTTIRK